MSLNDFNNWRIEDPYNGVPLADIASISSRATALLARSKSSLLHTNFIQIYSALSILSGIEYHQNRFVEGISKLPTDIPRDFSSVMHEAVAWVNRVGQFYYFKSSALVVNHGSVPATPTIDSIMIFRDKHTAHRSADKPRYEDTFYLQTIHAASLSGMIGFSWIPRLDHPGKSLSSPSIKTHMLSFQIQMPEGKAHDLVIERDSFSILLEGYTVFESLLQ